MGTLAALFLIIIVHWTSVSFLDCLLNYAACFRQRHSAACLLYQNAANLMKAGDGWRNKQGTIDVDKRRTEYVSIK